jgi:hypothetical protein
MKFRSGWPPLQDLVSGFDFATVVQHYCRAYDEGSEEGKTAALRWLRAEYGTRTEAKAALGVREIIDDARFYDYLKLYAAFMRLAGYGGLLVVLDEMVNLYKLTNSASRSANYEQILRILNDVLQGGAAGIGFLMGGTPEFLMDPRRGLYSYSALQSRLAENRFAQNGLVDLSGPYYGCRISRKKTFSCCCGIFVMCSALAMRVVTWYPTQR